jgi:hypothetical protein
VPTFRAGSEAREKQNHDIWGGFNSGRTAAMSHVPGRNATPKHNGQDEEKPRFSRAFSLFYLFIPFTLFLFSRSISAWSVFCDRPHSILFCRLFLLIYYPPFIFYISHAIWYRGADFPS